MRSIAIGGLACLALACGGGAGAGSSATPTPEERGYALDVPAGHDATRPTALVLLLHGYTSDGRSIDGWWGLRALSDARDVLVAHPDGLRNPAGARFWNANDACCDFYGQGQDDVAFLRWVIADVSARYAVDPGRVYVVGHSNGAAMAHRLACDAAEVVAAIAAVAGGVWKDASRCQPSAPVAVLQVFGTTDPGYAHGDAYTPSAAQDVATWAEKNGCGGTLDDTGERLDLDAAAPGPETEVGRYACAAGAVELWSMDGVGHVPAPRLPQWGEALLDWLEAHRRTE